MNYETIGTTVLQNEIEPRLDFIENNDQNIGSTERALKPVLARLRRDVAMNREDLGLAFGNPIVDLLFHLAQFVIDTLKDFDLLHVASFEASGSDVDTREREAPEDLGIGSAGTSPHRSLPRWNRGPPLEPWAPVGTVGPRWNRGLIDFGLLLALVKPIRSHGLRKLYSSQGKLERADRWK